MHLKRILVLADITTDFLYKEEDTITACLNTRVDSCYLQVEYFKKDF